MLPECRRDIYLKLASGFLGTSLSKLMDRIEDYRFVTKQRIRTVCWFIVRLPFCLFAVSS